MVKLTNIIKVVLFLFCTSLVAQTEDSREAAMEKALPRFEKSIQEAMKTSGIPGLAVAVVSKDKVYYLKTFGVKRVGSPDKINPTTLFQIASLSKPINATMVGILQEQGKVSFDDPVSDHIPYFKNQKDPLKICHLMSHSTGIPKQGFDEMIQAQKPRHDILNKLQNTRRVAPPGKQFAYHNATYGVVEDVIMSASKKSLPQTLQEELFAPLGMKHICLGYQPLIQAQDRAYPHVQVKKGKYIPAPNYSNAYYTFLAAGGINASIQDLVPFLQLYLGKPSPIVSKKTLKQLITPFIKNTKAVMLSEAPKGRVNETYYGFGWHSMKYAHHQVIYHQGHLKGFRNFMGFLPDDVGIIILTNADKKHASKIAMKFFDYYISPN